MTRPAPRMYYAPADVVDDDAVRLELDGETHGLSVAQQLFQDTWHRQLTTNVNTGPN